MEGTPKATILFSEAISLGKATGILDLFLKSKRNTNKDNGSSQDELSDDEMGDDQDDFKYFGDAIDEEKEQGKVINQLILFQKDMYCELHGMSREYMGYLSGGVESNDVDSSSPMIANPSTPNVDEADEGVDSYAEEKVPMTKDENENKMPVIKREIQNEEEEEGGLTPKEMKRRHKAEKKQRKSAKKKEKRVLEKLLKEKRKKSRKNKGIKSEAPPIKIDMDDEP